jgi:hypothetical protein
MTHEGCSHHTPAHWDITVIPFFLGLGLAVFSESFFFFFFPIASRPLVAQNIRTEVPEAPCSDPYLSQPPKTQRPWAAP